MIRIGSLLYIILLFTLYPVHAARLAIVIDDFGYRHKNEMAIIELSDKITAAVLPYSPQAKQIATYANQHGNDVMIHLPMAPMGKQPLEKDTLFPDMSQQEVDRIVTEALNRVPYAIGVNNHMGSLMTASSSGMDKVMLSLSKSNLFFLDSRTIHTTQAPEAANKYQIMLLSRDVFLDDSIAEDKIAEQFDLAIQMARMKGEAIAIGHPYSATVNVLKAKIDQLPKDITLVKISQLLPEQNNKMTLGDIWSNLKTDTQTLFYEWFIQKQALNKY